ncbi:hypothetical protein [Salmonella phage SETP7]|uniref:Uncharacterized protein n=3 Tax=Jerseyvirus TaxID=1910991 RepID=U5N135_9CAUD|nr:hypothetical protein V184_gp48 [Salmonella phage SETP7]WCZ56558.1 hypothetical protein K6_047 [Salmonella phage Kenya-K6]WCZ56624.1 hypothetical protein K9_046 [Salmonella phage Kenya-K9]WCZ56756.1 hypothetical protein K22_047 [Salmonella phage Kenya-K22]WCZ56880.1 hypothetical protein K47_049 [Salmonella phage Kenya-K47]WCZ56943.1 hypothetical protein K53_047 [Salmonella phage Kenya-K53]
MRIELAQGSSDTKEGSYLILSLRVSVSLNAFPLGAEPLSSHKVKQKLK